MQQSSRICTALLFALLIAAAVLAFGVIGHARPQSGSGSDKPFVVEYYYKTKWGHADEFITLFRKNHYPLLKKQVEMGRMLKVSAVAPSTTPLKMAGGIIASRSCIKTRL